MSRSILPGLEYPAVTEDGRIEGTQHPTSPLDAANKEYVDTAVANMRWDFYFNAAASGIGAYYEMANLPTGDAESTFTSNALGAGDDQLIFSWITDTVVPFTSIEAGVIDIHLHAQRTIGNRYTVLYAEVYDYTSTPTEVPIGTTELSEPITDTKTHISFHLTLGDDYEIAATSKLLVKVYANLGAGAATTIALHAEGTTAARIALPVPSEALNDIYIRHSLATAASDFLAASGAGVYVKKTLAETLALISPLTTRGDMMFMNASVNTRLAKGNDNTILAMGANDPEWKTPAAILSDIGAQPLDADLTSIALLGTAADKMLYTTNTDVWAEAAITAAGRSMVGAANAAAQLALMTTAIKAELD
ncbi:hypothetical protein LCGC14_2372050, partial [marine sediment metagenome]